MRRLLQHWTESIIHFSHFKRRVSLEEKKAKKRIVSSVEDSSLTWSTSTSGSLEPMILSRIMPTYLLLVFEMMIFRNSIQSGTEFYCLWRNPIWWHLGRIVQIKNTTVWETQGSIGIVRPGDSSEESCTWLSQIEDNGKKKYRAESTNQEFLKPETEIMKETPWSRTRGKTAWTIKSNDVNKCGTMTQSNASPRSFMQQSECNASITRSPRGKSPVEACLDGLARITSKELAPIHSVKNGTLQNACSTRPRVVADLGRSALMHIARLKNSLAKGPKRMVTKVQWLCWKGMSSLKEQGDLFWTLIHQVHDILLRISGFGAAEVFIDFAEELKRTETNPMRSIHPGRGTSC